MKKIRLSAFFAIVVIVAAVTGVRVCASSDPYPGIPGKPISARLVNDLAGVLPWSFRDSLERALVAFDDTTSNQIAVVTIGDLGGMDVAEYALHLGNKWGVGTSLNNGVIVLLKPRGMGSDGSDAYVDVTIQVGRGLEGAIPDAYASRIIRNIMGPYLKVDDYTSALALGCREIQALACGEISQPRDYSDDDLLTFAKIVGVIFIVIIFFVVIGLIFERHDDGKGKGKRKRKSDGPVFVPPIIIGDSDSSSGSSGFGSNGPTGSFGGFSGGSFGGGGASGRF